MKAKDNTKYALISNGIVTEIFDSSVYPEWDETTITTIELTSDMQEWVVVGLRANADNTLTMPSLNEQKEMQTNAFSAFFASEVEALRGEFISSDEIDTYTLQIEQAKEFLKNNDDTAVPFIKALAEARGIALGEFAQKIVEKNTSYNESLAKLLGNLQSLKDKIKQATTQEELMAIEYVSPLA